MTADRMRLHEGQLAPFDRDFFGSDERTTLIGSGSAGGKATGLVFIRDILKEHFDAHPREGLTVEVPRFAVIGTDVFERFLAENDLDDALRPGVPDDRIAHAFQKASLPAEVVGDLRGLIEAAHTPLAVRSSSLLEDALYEPFAGVYATKMIPNNQHDGDTRFRRFVEAVKFVYASTFFKEARDYIAMTGHAPGEEKMAVVVQEVVGQRFEDRYYPHLSAVARSHNYYPTGNARPGEGVVDLAVGLGKTIVDGGLAWTYSPAWPRAVPPVSSPSELLKKTQCLFWAVNMGRPSEYDPLRETEYMVSPSISAAEDDGTLELTASTYRAQDDRIVPGLRERGPRVVDFGRILRYDDFPLNDVIGELLSLCEDKVGSEVEIELALTFGPDRGRPARLGFLQVRPMVVTSERVALSDGEMDGPGVLAASEKVLGNGTADTIRDVVYVKPEPFEAAHTKTVAAELDGINRDLVTEGRPYLLIGFGRWGSSDPWLGVPVAWSQISGAKVIVEATLPGMDVELSQGSHFFHNITSFRICYFSIHHAGPVGIDWSWLDEKEAFRETDHVRHVRLERPLAVKVDGRQGRGVISHET